MYKILTVVASLAILALGTSIVTAILQQSTISKQTKQITALRTEQAVERRDIAQLEAKLHISPVASVPHLAGVPAGVLAASVLGTSAARLRFSASGLNGRGRPVPDAR